MRAILIADLHAHAWKEFATTVDHEGCLYNSRLLDCLEVFGSVHQEIQRQPVDLVIVAGDVFHRRLLIDVSVFNAVAEGLRGLARVVERVVLVVGNHDLGRRGWQGDHALESFRSRDILVVDTPRLIDGVGLVPYIDDADQLKRALCELSNASCLIMHAGVSGARVGALEAAYRPREPLMLGDFPDVPIYSGHYHYPHLLRMKGRQHPYVYIGAPLEHTRGDGHSDRRGVIVLDLEQPASYKRIPYHGPRFVEVTVGNWGLGDVVGHFVDLVVPTDEVEAAVEQTRLLTEAGARGVAVKYVSPQKRASVRIQLAGGGNGAVPSIERLCKAYVRENHGLLDKRQLMALAVDALGEAELGQD